jgi:hypothetical protein
MDKLSSRVVERYLVAAPLDEYLDFNTKLAKLLQRLKKDAGATVVSQGYRGTGSQAYRRQVFVRFENTVVDLWLEAGMIRIGGVLRDRVPPPVRKGVAYENKSPEQVYGELVKLLKAWLEGFETT